MAKYRSLQSWYREHVLKVPPGLDARGRVLSSLLPAEAVEAKPGLNFVSPDVTTYVDERVDQVLQSGGTMEEDRLRRNMLSSMPLCFNLFGALRNRPELRGLLQEAFGTSVKTIESVECEWAPLREFHLNDRTAFDAIVTYFDDRDRRCFLAVETKYTEPFSQKEYDSPLYQEVTTRTGIFRDGAGTRLVGKASNQLWRMTMLAGSMVHAKEFEAGTVAVVCLADDKRAEAAVYAVSQDLIPDDFVKLAPLEIITQIAATVDGLKDWAESFSKRYLDLTPVLADQL